MLMLEEGKIIDKNWTRLGYQQIWIRACMDRSPLPLAISIKLGCSTKKNKNTVVQFVGILPHNQQVMDLIHDSAEVLIKFRYYFL